VTRDRFSLTLRAGATEGWVWPDRRARSGQARLPQRGSDLPGLAHGRDGRTGTPPATEGRPGPVRPRVGPDSHVGGEHCRTPLRRRAPDGRFLRARPWSGSPRT
jgi:hypothetical protein